MMRKTFSVLMAAAIALAGVTVAAPTAQSHGNSPGESRDMHVVKVVDIRQKNRSRIVLQYSDQMRGEEVRYNAYHWLMSGMRKTGPWLQGDWRVPHRQKLLKGLNRVIVLPEDANTVVLHMPWDVGRGPGNFNNRKDALRYTFVALHLEDDSHPDFWTAQAYARIMTARKGDPVNYFWQRNRFRRVWDAGEDVRHHHRFVAVGA